MIIISFYSYQSASEALKGLEEAKLDATARVNVQFIRDWFYETQRDIESWANFSITKAVLMELSQWQKQSPLPLSTYVKSSQYHEKSEPLRKLFSNLAGNYSYIYDLLLIDLEGNVLVSKKNEADLGTNLQIGPFASTRLASTVRASLRDQKNHFSDIEHYAPSGGNLTGFMSVPVFDDTKKMIGVLVLQMELKNMYTQLENNNAIESSIRHYLVGSDGRLRMGGKLTEKRIDSELFRKWKNGHNVVSPGEDVHIKEKAIYTGPDGSLVLGKHYDVDIMGVKWIHVSEITVEEAFKSSRDLGQMLLAALVTVSLAMVGAAIYFSGRITRPILALRDATLAFASGKKKAMPSSDLDNEIGDLEAAFRQMVEKQLEDAREIALLAQVVTVYPYPTIIGDSAGVILYVNEQMIRESGYTKEELVGTNMARFRSRKHNDEYYTDLWKTISVDKKVWHGMLVSETKNGEFRDWQATIFPLLEEDHEVVNYVYVVEDITEQNSKDRLFVQQTRQAQMGEMLSMIAHQWRQPLAIINSLVGQVQFKNAMRSEPDPVLEENLYKIEEQSMHLSHTINDFRNFFNPNKQEEEIMCSTLVQNAVRLIDHSIKVSSLDFSIKVAADSCIKTFSNELMQVMITLIKNSLDAFEENKIKERILTILIDKNESDAIITIQDNGGGISEKVMKEIFSPYFTTKGDKEGTGLGLYMSKMVVEEHCKGKLTVQSKDAKSTFSIVLPMKCEIRD